jgi:hypothetical protein
MFAKPNGGAREPTARTAVCKVPAMFCPATRAGVNALFGRRLE